MVQPPRKHWPICLCIKVFHCFYQSFNETAIQVFVLVWVTVNTALVRTSFTHTNKITHTGTNTSTDVTVNVTLLSVRILKNFGLQASRITQTRKPFKSFLSYISLHKTGQISVISFEWCTLEITFDDFWRLSRYVRSSYWVILHKF